MSIHTEYQRHIKSAQYAREHEGYSLQVVEPSGLVAGHKQVNGKTYQKIWASLSGRQLSFYSFTSEVEAEKYLATVVHQTNRQQEAKQARKKAAAEARAALKASDHYAVGDVVYASWGYDQTNIDWYQVVEVGAKSVKIRPVAAASSDAGGPTGGHTQPIRGRFTGEAQIRILSPDGSIRDRHSGLYKWDGRPKYTSSYH